MILWRMFTGGVLLARVRGPFAGVTGCVTVFSEDGHGMWQGSEGTIPALDEGDAVVFRYGMTIGQILRKPGTVAP